MHVDKCIEQQHAAYIVSSPGSKDKDTDLGIGGGNIPVCESRSVSVADSKGWGNDLNDQHKIPPHWWEDLQDSSALVNCWGCKHVSNQQCLARLERVSYTMCNSGTSTVLHSDKMQLSTHHIK